MESVHDFCPVSKTLSYIGGRWKVVILFYLQHGKRRFGEISARIPNISRKVLTEQLKELETDGLIQRTSFKEVPPRVEYSITALGLSLNKVLKEMEVWGFEHRGL
ncbi:MAG: helix-turn-helix transcriptional regulator [Chitinophagaceae bacterium]|nr:helix-turn-helix transcriptional regulator [Chitinophagaceae bacterium]